MRVMVYGDSNSWGTPPDGSGVRFGPDIRWPCVMATDLGAELIEECLPGRTTIHDDPQMLGPAMNGLLHLPVALKSHNPLDWLLIMLGTNDFKARFAPSALTITENIGRLVGCTRETGGGPGPWDSATPPRIGVIVPPPLPAQVNDANWERRAEWQGGHEVSLGLADNMALLESAMGVAVLDAGKIASASPQDPIHMDADNHKTLGHAVAGWLRNLDRATR